MKKRGSSKREGLPLLYYKTREEIEAYQKRPVELKLQWLEAQMEFFHKVMSPRAKRIREEFQNPGLKLSIRDVSLSREILRERNRSQR